MPWELVRAIEHANRILDWQENLMSDEMPPQWMWHIDSELEIWFDGVEQARKDKYSSPNDDDRESGPMMSNQFKWDKE